LVVTSEAASLICEGLGKSRKVFKFECKKMRIETAGADDNTHDSDRL